MKKTYKVKRRKDMLNEEICKKREELNRSIIEGKDYSIIYKLSVELDELIAEFYRKDKKNEEKYTLFRKKCCLFKC